MNNVLAAIFFLMSSQMSAQDLSYLFQESGTYSVSQNVLKNAKNISDIHERYKAHWVDQYLSTEISLNQNGKTFSANGKNGKLNAKQIRLLQSANVDAEIKLLVHYIPKNNLKENSPKEMDYTFKVSPAKSAQFMGVEDYIQENIISKITLAQKGLIDIGKFKLNVSTTGEIQEIEIVRSTSSTAVDELVVKALQSMPKWSAAQNIKKEAISQEIKFYLIHSDKSCLIHELKD